MSVELLHVDVPNGPLAVLRYEPRRARGVTLVAGHGYSSSKQNLDLLCAFLSAHGFRIYSFDFPGHKLGASGGRLGSFEDAIAAMRAVVDEALRNFAQPAYVMGHSMGAMTALRAAARDPRIAGAIAIATGYGRSAALDAMQGKAVVDLRSSYVDGLTLPELVAQAAAGYDDDLAKLAGRPLLFIGAERDMMVSRASVSELFDRAPQPKTLKMVASDHTYAGENSRAQILEWLNTMHERN